MKTYPFLKQYRLLKSSEFREVYDKGRILRSKAFVLFYIAGAGVEERPARLGMTVTKSFGKAARRNRIKRLIRESFRVLHPNLSSGLEAVVNVRRPADRLSQKDVQSQLSSLFDKAGVRHAGSDR